MPPTPKTHTTPAEWVDLLVRHAKALRDAGVTSVEIAGCRATIAPAQPDIEIPEDDEPGYMADPLSDPSTFGGRVPSMRSHREHDS